MLKHHLCQLILQKYIAVTKKYNEIREMNDAHFTLTYPWKGERNNILIANPQIGLHIISHLIAHNALSRGLLQNE